jgi:hypothetical protein
VKKNLTKQLQKIGTGIVAATMVIASFAMPALAAGSVTYTPWTFEDPAGVCPGVAATQNTGGSVTLSKPCPTPTNASAGVTLNNVPSTVTTVSFDYNGYCGAGAPRFNVYTSNYGTIFLGCAYGGGPTGTNVTGTATFTAGGTYGGVLFPSDAVVTGVDVVQDEQGTVTISNITVNGTAVTYANAPTSKDQCKKDGYKTLTDQNGNAFRNQGQCVSYFNHVSK